MLGERGLDGVLVTHPLNVRYLTGFTGSNGALLLSARDARLYTDGRYRTQAGEEAPDLELEVSQDPLLKVAAADVRRLALGALGAEMGHLSWAQYRELAEGVGEERLRGQERLVESLRAVKEPEELAALGRTESLADRVFAGILEWLRPGMTELEAAARINYELQLGGASGIAFETIVASGPRGALPHGLASAKRIERGELVVLDFGGMVDGYAADITRTVMMGEPGAEERRVYDAVLAAHAAGLRAARAGAVARDVDQAARGELAARGLAEAFTHSLGHGVGLAVHEEPRLSVKNEETLVAGMVVTIEPGVYLPGWGGVRIEDLVVVRDGEPELLSHSPRELCSIRA
jgi:Xaa-Pro aminopeptidase